MKTSPPAALAALLLCAACGNTPAKNGSDAPRSTTALPAPAAEAAAEASEAFRIGADTTLRGCVVMAHEVRAFTPAGDSTEYWIIDRSGVLEREYDRATGGQKNGLPAEAELRLRYRGCSDEGFAAEYEGVFEVIEVLSLKKRP